MENTTLPEQSPEQIRLHIEETRASLVDKIGALEDQVRTKVEDARETVQEKIDSVKNAFSLTHQVNTRPWAVLGTAVAAGFLLQNLIAGKKQKSYSSYSSYNSHGSSYDNQSYDTSYGLSDEYSQLNTPYKTDQGDTPHYNPQSEAKSPKSSGNALSKLVAEFSDEIDQVKSIAIGTGIGLVRDLIKNGVPVTLRSHIDELAERTTQKLGGKQIKGEIRPSSQSSDETLKANENKEKRVKEEGSTPHPYSGTEGISTSQWDATPGL